MHKLAPKKKPPTVTIVIGFSIANAIIVATDSQLSDSASTAKQTRVPKIVVVDCGPTRALLAKAGTWDTAGVFHEEFERRAKDAVIQNNRSIADIAQASLTEARNKIIAAYSSPSFEPQATEGFLDARNSEFFLAYYHDEKTYFYTFNLHDGIVVRQWQAFVAIGCAANLASFILNGFPFGTLNPIQSWGLAVYTVEMCKRNDSACGGDVQIGTIHKQHQHKPILFSDIDENGHVLEYFTKAFETTGTQIHSSIVTLMMENFESATLHELRVLQKYATPAPTP